MSVETEQLHQQITDGLESTSPTALHDVLADAWPADIAEVLDLLDDEERSRVLFSLEPRVMAEVVLHLDEAARGQVVEELTPERLTEIVAEMPPDDAADVVADLPLEQFDGVLGLIPREHSDQITELLGYDDTSAGGLMNPRLLSLPVKAQVSEAVEAVRDFAADEDLHYVYCVDDDNKLVGIVPLRRLVVNRPDVRIEAICDREPVTVNVADDQEDVLHVMQKYDIAAVPVIDDDGRLRGRITHDDVMDVAVEEADEDIYRMAGTDAAELETHSAYRAARVRMGWLIPCIIGTLMAAVVIRFFRGTSLGGERIEMLLMFIPMIAATSGNAGIQTSTIILRGFATGELASSKIQWVFAREVRIAIFVGLLCSVLSGVLSAGVLVFDQDTAHVQRMAIAVSLGMLCAIAESVSLGIVLPFVFRRFGVDPAIASGPLITSANDLLSVTVYLAIALAILD